MKIVLATNGNIKEQMAIIGQAQSYLASLGIDQWQDGYPQENIILNDIANKESYLVISDTEEAMAMAMFSTQNEPTYSNIEGNWLTAKNARYGVIHRMAVSNSHRKMGLAKFIMKSFEQKLKESKIPSMRIDTHEQNLGMQNLLKGLGYKYCGVIYVNNGSKRLAYEKLIL